MLCVFCGWCVWWYGYFLVVRIVSVFFFFGFCLSECSSCDIARWRFGDCFGSGFCLCLVVVEVLVLVLVLISFLGLLYGGGGDPRVRPVDTESLVGVVVDDLVTDVVFGP